MPTHGAQQRALPTTCNSAPGVPEPAPTRWTWKRTYRDDIDDVVVQKLVAGERISGTRYERLEAVRYLHRARLSIRQIARRLGVDDKQVDRDLLVLGLRAVEELGRRRRQKERAACRRPVVRALVEAGARRREIAMLLNVAHNTVQADFTALGIHGTGQAGRRPLRSRDELLATFGHLLGTDEHRAGVA